EVRQRQRHPVTTEDEASAKPRSADPLHDPILKARIEREAREQAGRNHTGGLLSKLPSAKRA
ncbi:MAG: hypothetical protein KGH52_04445, partial [Candidatus Micrarchaeota archaeon]|nr:hypothetical protein [Candidatus Micrarchaeota archaeon]